MSRRKSIPKQLETDVLLASGRRCCLCVFLKQLDEVRKGQIAHLNRDPKDFRFDNLIWLCLEHHDEYDSNTSQSKGLTTGELRAYRDKLYLLNDPQGKWQVQAKTQLKDADELRAHEQISEYETARINSPRDLEFTTSPWRFPLWQIANEPEFFAYKARNGADGICLIERIDLPDERIVVACIETAGNPGQSITNCAEHLCFQVCERFDIQANRLVWLEHYDDNDWDDWSMVTFEQKPPHRPFENPKWTDMTPELWRDLRLKPKKKLTKERNDYHSKLTKLFPWPTEALF